MPIFLEACQQDAQIETLVGRNERSDLLFHAISCGKQLPLRLNRKWLHGLSAPHRHGELSVCILGARLVEGGGRELVACLRHPVQAQVDRSNSEQSPHHSCCVAWQCVQDFHFLLQDPRTLELIFKPREAQRIIEFDTFFKGFRRVLNAF